MGIDNVKTGVTHIIAFGFVRCEITLELALSQKKDNNEIPEIP